MSCLLIKAGIYAEGVPMDLQLAINRLATEDCLDEWPKCIATLPEELRIDAYNKAEPLWVRRMIHEGKPLINPAVINDLKDQKWKPSDLHRRMIWASFLASIDGPNSKDRFNSSKLKIIKKHGKDWWFDVYQRIKPAYAARMRIKKKSNIGPAVRQFTKHSSVLTLALHAEYEAALNMIPAD